MRFQSEACEPRGEFIQHVLPWRNSGAVISYQESSYMGELRILERSRNGTRVRHALPANRRWKRQISYSGFWFATIECNRKFVLFTSTLKYGYIVSELRVCICKFLTYR